MSTCWFILENQQLHRDPSSLFFFKGLQRPILAGGFIFLPFHGKPATVIQWVIQRVIDNSEGETGAQSIKSSVFFCNSCFTVREMKLCMSALASVLHFLNIISPAVLILPRIVHACCCTFSDKISPVVVILPPWIILIL